jgi:hypothetical protein
VPNQDIVKRSAVKMTCDRACERRDIVELTLNPARLDVTPTPQEGGNSKRSLRQWWLRFSLYLVKEPQAAPNLDLNSIYLRAQSEHAHLQS